MQSESQWLRVFSALTFLQCRRPASGQEQASQSASTARLRLPEARRLRWITRARGERPQSLEN
jgi:hypothetical protein